MKHEPKREKIELTEFWEDESRVAQRDPTRRTVRPPTVAQCDPIIYRSSKDHPEDHHPPPPAAEGMPGSFELGVARREGTFGEILQELPIANGFFWAARCVSGARQTGF